MITRVKLQNWKCHGETELEFLQGTNVIVGVMGAGKSAVLDAISFALFGTFPALNAKKTSIDSCVTNKPEQKSRGSVEAFFTVNGKDYSIIREITVGKGTTRSELREGDSLIEGPQTKRVTEEVVRLLGMDYDLFSRAVYSEQNQIDYFLQIPSGQRKKKIDELLKINRFEEARKAASSLARQLKGESTTIQSQLENMPLPETEKEKEALTKIEQRKKESAEQCESAKKKLAEAEHKTRELEQHEKKRDSLRTEINSAESKAEVLTRSQKEIDAELEKSGDVGNELDSVKKRFGEAIEKIKALEGNASRQKKADVDQKAALLKSRITELAAKMEERKRLLDEKEKLKGWPGKLVEARKEREGLLARQKGLEVAISDSEKRVSALSETEGHCPVCDSEISGVKRGELEKSAKEKVEASKTELGSVKEKLAGIDLTEMEKKVKGLESLTTRLEELYVGKELSEAREEYSSVEKEATSLAAECGEQEKALAELRKEKEELASSVNRLESLLKSKEKLEGITKEKDSLAEKVSALKKELDALRFDEKELASARQQSKELSAKAAELEAGAKAADELLGEKKKLIAEMEERAKEIGSLKKRCESLDSSSASMGVFRKAVEDTQVQLREQFVTGVNDALSMVWKQVYPYSDYPRLRLAVEGGDYALEVETVGGTWVNVEGFASGGEKSTAALALRIAFSMVLAPQLSWLVLDEPTHNLDSNGVARLSKTMRESLPELVEQVFVITHDDEMEAAVSGNLYRIEREKADDEPAKAVLVSSGKG
ncbi:AAA family ATPase [archaeon]